MKTLVPYSIKEDRHAFYSGGFAFCKVPTDVKSSVAILCMFEAVKRISLGQFEAVEAAI